MECLRGALIVGALAVVVSLVAVGPAAAAKGANKDNAHACQQGGSAGLFDENQSPFKNAGDCASHGAAGRTYTGLSIVMDRYDNCFGDGAPCYGTVNGSGLQANQPVAVVTNFSDGSNHQDNPNADGSGNLVYKLNIECDESSGAVNATSVFAEGTLANGTDFTTPTVGTPCEA